MIYHNYHTIIIYTVIYERRSSRHKASLEGRGDRETADTHVCSYFLIRAIPRAGSLLMDSEMNDRGRRSEKGDEKKVTCRRKIQVAAAARTAIATHFIYADVRHRIYCYYLIVRWRNASMNTLFCTKCILWYLKHQNYSLQNIHFNKIKY